MISPQSTKKKKQKRVKRKPKDVPVEQDQTQNCLDDRAPIPAVEVELNTGYWIRFYDVGLVIRGTQTE